MNAMACGLALVLAGGEPNGVEPGNENSDRVQDELATALAEGETWLRLRVRYEHVDDEAFSKEANAGTLRTVLGYRTGIWRDLQGTVEFEAVTHLFNDLFNSTTNGELGRPVVADPEQAEVNQAFITWDGLEDTQTWIGRRRIKLDNARFIGNVGWRQNEQTYDSLGFEHTFGEHAKLFYAYLANVNRIFGDDNALGDARSRSHLVNLSGDVQGLGRITGYWYYIDNDSPAALDTFSTSTVGSRLTGEQELESFDILYAAEFATQADVSDNPNEVDADYLRGEIGMRLEGTSARLGYEQLGGSGDPGDKFTTPLATLHAHNGWADKFLVTPDGGLEDLFVDVSGTIHGVHWRVAWHEFGADSGGADFGSELDAALEFDWTESTRVGFKVARYEADDFAADTTKVWFWLSTSLR